MSYEQIETFAHSIGLSTYDFTDDNLITPADQAILLKKLYEGNLLTTDHTKLLLSYMQHTNNEDLIPAALPTSAVVYHKYGEIMDNYDEHLGYYLHDSAIIEINGQHIVLTIYTRSSSSVNKTAQINAIHKITTAVTDFIQAN